MEGEEGGEPTKKTTYAIKKPECLRVFEKAVLREVVLGKGERRDILGNMHQGELRRILYQGEEEKVGHKPQRGKRESFLERFWG